MGFNGLFSPMRKHLIFNGAVQVTTTQLWVGPFKVRHQGVLLWVPPSLGTGLHLRSEGMVV